MALRLLNGANRYAPRSVLVFSIEGPPPRLDRARALASLYGVQTTPCQYACAPLAPERLLDPGDEVRPEALMAALALLLQRALGYPVQAHGPAEDGWWVEALSLPAARDLLQTAWQLLQVIARGATPEALQAAIARSIEHQVGVEIRRHGAVSCWLMTATLQRLGIACRPPRSGAGLFEIGIGNRAQRYYKTIPEGESHNTLRIEGNKHYTSTALAEAGIEVPDQRIADDLPAALRAAAEIGYPVVIKPESGQRTLGVAVDLADEAELRAAWAELVEPGSRSIVERYFVGEDIRIFTVDGATLRVYRRARPTVTGDGRSTVRELALQLNDDPRRGDGVRYMLERIDPEALAAQVRSPLRRRGVTLDTVLPAGETLPLSYIGVITFGGFPDILDDRVHPDFLRLARRIHAVLPIRCCGIDIICKDVTAPIVPGSYAVNEINRAPGIITFVAEGGESPTSERFIRMLYGDPEGLRVPVVLIVADERAPDHTAQAALALGSDGGIVVQASRSGYRAGDLALSTAPHDDLKGTERALADREAAAIVLERRADELGARGLGLERVDLAIFVPATPGALPEMLARAGFVDRASRCGSLVVGDMPQDHAHGTDGSGPLRAVAADALAATISEILVRPAGADKVIDTQA